MDYKEMLALESEKYSERVKPYVEELKKGLNVTNLELDKEKLVIEIEQAPKYLQNFNENVIDLHTNLGEVIKFIDINKFTSNKMIVVETNKQLITNLSNIQKKLTQSIDNIAHKLNKYADEVDKIIEESTEQTTIEEHKEKCSCGKCK